MADDDFAASVTPRIATPKPPLTSEELELLATPNEELRLRTEVDSFDAQRFSARILSGEKWQQLLQAHLYFDHVVTLILTESLYKPDAINVSRTGFSQKLQLITALNLLPPTLIPAIEFLNGLRNKIAHDLNFEIVEKNVEHFANCIPKYLREMTAASEEGKEFWFGKLLEFLLMQIEIIRQEHQFERLVHRKQMIRARVMLEQIPNAVYRV